MTGLRLKRAAQPLTGRWQEMPVQPRGATRLGISFRPLQAADLGLDPDDALSALLEYPFQVIRLAAYWNRLEPGPGRFEPGELDRQLDAAEQAGKQVIVCVGPVKAFGYPEFFVPPHHLDRPLREGALVTPEEHRRLLEAGTAFVTRVIERYRDRNAIIAWQVEHEAVDPLGVEHSWRLSESFVARRGRRGAHRRPGPPGADERLPAHVDPGRAAAAVAHPRPGRLAGGGAAAGRHRRRRLLPPARAGQRRAADRCTWTAAGPARQRRRRERLLDRAAAAGRRLMIAEGPGGAVGGGHDPAEPARAGPCTAAARRI